MKGCISMNIKTAIEIVLLEICCSNGFCDGCLAKTDTEDCDAIDYEKKELLEAVNILRNFVKQKEDQD